MSDFVWSASVRVNATRGYHIATKAFYVKDGNNLSSLRISFSFGIFD